MYNLIKKTTLSIQNILFFHQYFFSYPANLFVFLSSEVCPGHLTDHPGCVIVVRGNGLKLLDGLFKVVRGETMVGGAEFAEKVH